VRRYSANLFFVAIKVRAVLDVVPRHKETVVVESALSLDTDFAMAHT
jgi:hypothetical protein